MRSTKSTQPVGASTQESREAPQTGAPSCQDLLAAWIHVANMQVSPRTLAAWIAELGGDPRALLSATDAELERLPEFHPRLLDKLRDPDAVPSPKQLACLDQAGMQMTWLGHPAYPRSLRDIPDPPLALFQRGAICHEDRFAVAMVGSRHATPYGRSVAERMARELAARGLTVVSGGAVGIDTAAHRGALASGGRTIAVLGCGVDVDYPRENRALFNEIANVGAVVSEYPFGVQPEPWRFPARNRIISGMSEGTLVVEAPRGSGALITARFAADQGRTVMAVPGNIDRETAAGTNQLLKDGAAVVTGVDDVLQALDMLVMQPLAEPGESCATPASPKGIKASNPEEARLVAALSLTPRHIDSLSDEAGMTAAEASVALTMLEMRGQVRRLAGNTYILVL